MTPFASAKVALTAVSGAVIVTLPVPDPVTCEDVTPPVTLVEMASVPSVTARVAWTLLLVESSELSVIDRPVATTVLPWLTWKLVVTALTTGGRNLALDAHGRRGRNAGIVYDWVTKFSKDCSGVGEVFRNKFIVMNCGANPSSLKS